jgi:hypothetical protein
MFELCNSLVTIAPNGSQCLPLFPNNPDYENFAQDNNPDYKNFAQEGMCAVLFPSARGS